MSYLLMDKNNTAILAPLVLERDNWHYSKHKNLTVYNSKLTRIKFCDDICGILYLNQPVGDGDLYSFNTNIANHVASVNAKIYPSVAHIKKHQDQNLLYVNIYNYLIKKNSKYIDYDFIATSHGHHASSKNWKTLNDVKYPSITRRDHDTRYLFSVPVDNSYGITVQSICENEKFIYVFFFERVPYAMFQNSIQLNKFDELQPYEMSSDLLSVSKEIRKLLGLQPVRIDFSILNDKISFRGFELFPQVPLYEPLISSFKKYVVNKMHSLEKSIEKKGE